ncbi:MAG: hypothetical protein CMM06_02490 [Rhodopirellula sp.]|nr:hypothetical protein [Rhodopirellula sp.]MCH2598119.1 MoaD/ThiS family protein [Pirellulales bacterium]HCA48837.1 hypothetical protein [Planctomycetaceae bacterium]|tara:strand:- start:50264 stop:50539 length:276 start_codon:yes stop_codon:yes gene_type:complete
MKIKIEYYGIPRQRVGLASEILEFEGEQMGIHDVILAISNRHPEFQQHCMDGTRIDKNFTVNLNGDRFYQEDDGVAHDGDSLLILSMDAGG